MIYILTYIRTLAELHTKKIKYENNSRIALLIKNAFKNALIYINLLIKNAFKNASVCIELLTKKRI